MTQQQDSSVKFTVESEDGRARLEVDSTRIICRIYITDWYGPESCDPFEYMEELLSKVDPTILQVSQDVELDFNMGTIIIYLIPEGGVFYDLVYGRVEAFLGLVIEHAAGEKVAV